MSTRVMSEPVKNAAEAYRRSREIFDAGQAVDAVCWPSKDGFIWIRRTPGKTGHLSGKAEAHEKMYDFEVQRARSASSDRMPGDGEFNAVMKAWAEEYERLSPRAEKSTS